MISIDQIGIALTGVTAVFLTQSKYESRRRYACLFGIAGQPFWFWSAISAEQWGVILVCVLYTFAWAKGVWMHWLQPRFSRPVGVVQAIELSFGGAGNQWMKIDGFNYATWIDYKSWPPIGARVRHRPYKAPDGHGGQMIATDIIEVLK